MSQPTKQQWDEIAEQLDRLMCPVYLRCDGHLIMAELARVEKNRLGIFVSVNGWRYKGEWVTLNGHKKFDEVRRFWRPVKRQKVKRKELKLFERIYGKRECRRRGYYEPNIWPTPVWLRPRPLIQHLRKHNEHIKVLDRVTFWDELQHRREAAGDA